MTGGNRSRCRPDCADKARGELHSPGKGEGHEDKAPRITKSRSFALPGEPWAGERLPNLGAGNRHDVAFAELLEAPASVYSPVTAISPVSRVSLA